ncbi:ABC transporter permease [Sedimentibacter sp. zth1]|uniref:ABC transporter permease n=1 Tax=Sedimentibacter sp. zth1 TaxID=2816908 RepID=UPI001A9116B5|nr:ABC transporter permease [Sedimentibacter sp. zth1]QSX04717.1 ABC transporter permease [Sedimentibacter sp. zth1]
MTRYILKRIFSAIITIWFVMTITFILMHNLPGDPFAGERAMDPVVRQSIDEQYGFDKPFIVQYVKYLGNFVTGDFGISFKKRGVETIKIIEAGFPYSARIGGAAIIGIVIFGILFGIIAALKQNKAFDRIAMVLATLGATIPSFVIATGFIYIFNRKLGLVPSYGVSSWKGYIGPAIAIGMFSLSYVTRLTRSSVLEVLQQDYIRTARAKGISEKVVIGKHALRNALIPIVTYVGPMIASILTGSFVAEKVFGISGIGQLFTTSITNRDYPVIMGVTVFFAMFLVVAVLIVDIVYVIIDPRIKFE